MVTQARPAARSSATAATAAWLAFMSGLFVDGSLTGLTSFGIAAVGGAALVVAGYAAASRCRDLAEHSNQRRVRLFVLSLAVGAGMGVANLVANWGIAEADPALRTLLVERLARLDQRAWTGLFVAPLTEEVPFRLFGMSVLAFLASRATRSAQTVFVFALVASAVVFAVPHLARPVPGDPALADFYRAALLTKYTVMGVPLGWIFWRWGLPYAMLAHGVANAAHMVLGPALF